MRISPALFALAALSFGCDDGDDPSAPDAAVPVFADDWAERYVELRDCRHSIEHDLEFIRVLADPAAAERFRACVTYEEPTDPACADPFAEGAVVLKAQYRDAACTDLLRWSAVRREAAAPAEGGGWRWQEVGADGTVRVDGAPPACVRCHQGCEGSRDLLCAMDP